MIVAKAVMTDTADAPRISVCALPSQFEYLIGESLGLSRTLGTRELGDLLASLDHPPELSRPESRHHSRKPRQGFYRRA